MRFQIPLREHLTGLSFAPCEYGRLMVSFFGTYSAKMVCFISDLSRLTKCSFCDRALIISRPKEGEWGKDETTALTTGENGLLPAVKLTFWLFIF